MVLSYLCRQEENWLKLGCQNERRQQMKEFILDALFEEGCLKFLDAKTVGHTCSYI